MVKNNFGHITAKVKWPNLWLCEKQSDINQLIKFVTLWKTLRQKSNDKIILVDLFDPLVHGLQSPCSGGWIHFELLHWLSLRSQRGLGIWKFLPYKVIRLQKLGRIDCMRGWPHKTSEYKKMQRRQGVARGVKCLCQIYTNPYNQSCDCGGFARLEAIWLWSVAGSKQGKELQDQMPYQFKRRHECCWL